MGIWDIIKKKIKNEEGTHHRPYEDVGAKNIYDIASFDLNNASLLDKMMYLLDNRSQGEQIQFADKLLREGPFEVSIKMYEALTQKYPEERDRYENGIGAAYLKLGEHEKAVEYFILARTHGMHPDISDKHIWDSCQKHYKSTGLTELIEKYPSFAPDGKYRNEAIRLMTDAGYSDADAEAILKEAVAETTAIKAGITPTDTPQTEDDVAKKAKTPENQISLFGGNDEKATSQEQASEQQPQAPDTEPANLAHAEAITPEEKQLPETAQPDMLTALDNHIDQFFDNEEVVVWKDKRDDDLKIDIYHIQPAEDRPYHLLITFGMSRKPMNVPESGKDFRYGELAAILPEAWDLSKEGMQDPNNYWPVLWLKNLARIPQQYDSWLCYGHSIPNGDPARAIANTPFEGVVILDSVTMPEDFQEVKVGEDTLYLYTMIPVYGQEMQLKIDQGVDALVDALGDAGIPDWIIPARPSAI